MVCLGFEPLPDDGMHRWIHWAMAAAILNVFVILSQHLYFYLSLSLSFSFFFHSLSFLFFTISIVFVCVFSLLLGFRESLVFSFLIFIISKLSFRFVSVFCSLRLWPSALQVYLLFSTSFHSLSFILISGHLGLNDTQSLQVFVLFHALF